MRVLPCSLVLVRGATESGGRGSSNSMSNQRVMALFWAESVGAEEESSRHFGLPVSE